MEDILSSLLKAERVTNARLPMRSMCTACFVSALDEFAQPAKSVVPLRASGIRSKPDSVTVSMTP